MRSLVGSDSALANTQSPPPKHDHGSGRLGKMILDLMALLFAGLMNVYFVETLFFDLIGENGTLAILRPPKRISTNTEML
jgi:hypothetical protein